jgi:signal transduction histidine kinase
MKARERVSPSDHVGTSAGGELARLRAELQVKTEEIANLERELLEANQGVVALYAELDDQAQRLLQLSELKSRFLAYVSHEFRAPLNSIRSVARILLERMDGPLTSEQEKQVRFVMASATELTEMVDDQLDLAKVEAGRITISPRWFELDDLFSALRGTFRPILTREDVALRFEELKGIPRLFSDDQKLAQILRNFISNGLKFTPRGEVRVSARLIGQAAVELSVTDTGIGIPPELLPTLFQEFVQLDSTLQRSLRGTGLGLMLCKRFAELLGGHVGVESQLGVGSKFHVTIPLNLDLSGDSTAAEGARNRHGA